MPTSDEPDWTNEHVVYSACTCEGEDHPGPNNKKGRGAPEIDVLEAQKNKLGPGAKVSQSAQFAPFSHDYFYPNTSQDDWWVYNSAVTQANTYLCVSFLFLSTRDDGWPIRLND